MIKAKLNSSGCERSYEELKIKRNNLYIDWFQGHAPFFRKEGSRLS